jgi:mono/diheme cytochrome c family protein
LPRTRTTKKLAQRIDLNYFRKPDWLRRWRSWLTLAAVALALVWIGWHAARRNDGVYSAGKLSAAHAVFSNRCSACHVSVPGIFFSRKVSDHACLDCHDGPIHHASQTFTPPCAACHADHRGAIRLAEVSDANCTQCHANLATRGGLAHYATHIESFSHDHPEFAVLRSAAPDPTTIRFNHALHMQAHLTGPSGAVQLVCDDCHHVANDADSWRFGTNGANAGEAASHASTPSGTNESQFATNSPNALMGPATYAATCAGCHTLQFDKRFSDQVPHDTPERIHTFVIAKFQIYIAAHPAELRELRQPNRDLPRRPVPADYRLLTPPEWVAEHTAEAEDLLWRKTCKECHTLNCAAGQAQVSAAPPDPAMTTPASLAADMPSVAPSNLTRRFFRLAKFDHTQHQLVSCESCHAAARTSQQSSEILVPGIATCRQCHHEGPQAAEARCFECHTYHDPSQRRFTPGHTSIEDLSSSLARVPTASATRVNANL